MVFSKSKFCQSLGPHTCGTEKPRTHLQPRHISAAPLGYFGALQTHGHPNPRLMQRWCVVDTIAGPEGFKRRENTEIGAERERERVCTCRKLKLLEIV